jgi:hypothetical protein
MKSWLGFVIIVAGLGLSWSQDLLSQSETASPEEAVQSTAIASSDLMPEALVALPPSTQNLQGLARTAILVGKKERTLRVFEFNDNLPREIYYSPTDLGKKDGDKERTNDHRTPVGLYFLTGRKSPPEIPFDLLKDYVLDKLEQEDILDYFDATDFQKDLTTKEVIDLFYENIGYFNTSEINELSKEVTYYSKDRILPNNNLLHTHTGYSQRCVALQQTKNQ